MKIEKQEVMIDHIKKCHDCDKYIFEGMNVFYIEIESLRKDIRLCQDCMNKFYAKVDEILDNE